MASALVCSTARKGRFATQTMTPRPSITALPFRERIRPKMEPIHWSNSSFPSPLVCSTASRKTASCWAYQGFRGGLEFKAHRLVYHSTLGLRAIKKRRRYQDFERDAWLQTRRLLGARVVLSAGGLTHVIGLIGKSEL